MSSSKSGKPSDESWKADVEGAIEAAQNAWRDARRGAQREIRGLINDEAAMPEPIDERPAGCGFPDCCRRCEECNKQ